MRSHGLRDLLALTLASAALGASLIVVSNGIAGRDLAGRLASTLRLASGPLLGALLGALAAAWLVLGGRRRVSGFTGFVSGLGAAVALWGIARGRMWIVDVILEGTFGPGADQFSGLAIIVVLFILGRLVADVVRSAARKLLERVVERGKPANP